MIEHVADRLLAAIDEKGAPVCVGLDPVVERLPAVLARKHRTPETALAAIVRFSSEVLQAVAPHVPAVKFQSACFERYRGAGLDRMYDLIAQAHRLGLIVVLDAKRGDIGVSASHYASGILDPDGASSAACAPSAPDLVTLSPYLGEEAIEPFRREGRGCFVLVRTSNPSGDALQTSRLEGGLTIAEHVAEMVESMNRGRIGRRGYGDVGAVVGATKADEIVRLRERMPHALLLVPGYGAQGGTADDVKTCFKPDGTGALITASRSIIFAYEQSSGGPGDGDWCERVSAAARQFAREVAAILRT